MRGSAGTHHAGASSVAHTSTGVTERTYVPFSPSFTRDAAAALEFLRPLPRRDFSVWQGSD